MERRRRTDRQNEQIVELNQVLEPYQDPAWGAEPMEPSEPNANFSADAMQTFAPGEQTFVQEEYSEEHEAADGENHFRIAIGMFDLISILIGVAVVFVLVGMLITLFNWLRNDIMHSALLLQSGLQ